MAAQDKPDDEDYILSAIGAFRKGASGLSSGMVLLLRGFWSWSDEHPILRWVITVLASTATAKLLFWVGGKFYTFFYGTTVPISEDIMLGTLPLPVGFSIYLLLTLWLITTIVAMNKVAELHEKIENLN